MNPIGIIGGTGLTRLARLAGQDSELVPTPYGAPSAALVRGLVGGREVVFLARHGSPHRIPPHRVNYRANLWALRAAGVRRIIAVAAVGGITEGMDDGRVIIPDQVIDYTYGRAHTFFEEDLEEVVHVDFTEPYTPALRRELIAAARELGLDAAETGTYAATQGPRLESAAEVDRLERDGCHIVGMTAMPEAALARELELEYASVAVVANRAAGRADGEITMDRIEATLVAGMERVGRLLETVLPRL